MDIKILFHSTSNRLTICKIIKYLFGIGLREAKSINDRLTPDVEYNLKFFTSKEAPNYLIENTTPSITVNYNIMVNAYLSETMINNLDSKIVLDGFLQKYSDYFKITITNINQNNKEMNMTPAIVVSPEKREKAKQIYLRASAKLDSLKEIDNVQLKTSGKFNNNTNIDCEIIKVSSIVKLLEILGFVIQQKTFYEAAIKASELSSAPVFQWRGHTYDAWLHDIKLCIQKLSIAKEIENSKEAMQAMQPYMDADIKAEQDFERFNSFL